MAFVRTSKYNINIVGYLYYTNVFITFSRFIDTKFILFCVIAVVHSALFRMYYTDVLCVCTYFNFINIFISLRLSCTHAQHTTWYACVCNVRLLSQKPVAPYAAAEIPFPGAYDIPLRRFSHGHQNDAFKTTKWDVIETN